MHSKKILYKQVFPKSHSSWINLNQYKLIDIQCYNPESFINRLFAYFFYPFLKENITDFSGVLTKDERSEVKMFFDFANKTHLYFLLSY